MTTSAQERLVELERGNAPINEQIQQATLFAGIPLSSLESSHPANNLADFKGSSELTDFPGRKEYVLRWLFKKFQEGETRRCPDAWRLLKAVVLALPVRTVAKVLNEKKFTVVLRQAIEELAPRDAIPADETQVAVEPGDESNETARRSPSITQSSRKSSKKRKRDEYAVYEATTSQSAVGGSETTIELLISIFGVLDSMVHLSKPQDSIPEALASEYMKSAIRTTEEEAAKILGGWLEICYWLTCLSTTKCNDSLLSPVLEVWERRNLEVGNIASFSEHCLQPSLAILSAEKRVPKWIPQLENLVARYVLVPAKAAYGSSANTDILKKLVGSSVSSSPRFAPILFEIAIRCLKPHGSRRHRINEVAWLEAVFGILKDAMVAKSRDTELLNVVMDRMLRSCMEHKIVFELLLLHSITSQYGLRSGSTTWAILASVIKLDANVLLIPPHSEALLNDLMHRITQASTEESWPTFIDCVVDDVLVPLMGEFAKARQLTTFIHHWFEQLVLFEDLCQGKSTKVKHFSAWEDEALLRKLENLMEESLTTQQIADIFEWLAEKFPKSEGATYVLLDAVTGALRGNEAITIVESKMHRMISNFPPYESLDKRYKLRRWRIVTNFLHCSSKSLANDNKFKSEYSGVLSSLLPLDKGFELGSHALVRLEAFRCLCAGWSQERAMSPDNAITSALVGQIGWAAIIINRVIHRLNKSQVLGEDEWAGRVVAIDRGSRWLACGYAHCILTEYPDVLELITTEPDLEGHNLLKDLIWIASATVPSCSTSSPSCLLQNNQNAFPSMWENMLQDRYVLNNPKLMGHIIAVMLECGSHHENPVEHSEACNGFVINCLHRVPLEVFSKSNRETIMKAWPLDTPEVENAAGLSYMISPLDPAVLSLKLKMMHRPTLYDGIKFQDLVDLAEAIVSYHHELKEVLPIFEQLAKLTLSHVFATVDQPKSREYISGMITFIRDWLRVNSEAKEVPFCAIIGLLRVATSALKTKAKHLKTLKIFSDVKLYELQNSFRKLLLHNLQRLLEKPEELGTENENLMSLYSTFDAVDDIGIWVGDLDKLRGNAEAVVSVIVTTNLELGKRFELFMIEHDEKGFGGLSTGLFVGDVTSMVARQGIQQRVLSATKRMTETEKLRVVVRLLDETSADVESLDKLLALKCVISSYEDTRDTIKEKDEDGTNGLSAAYTILADRLEKAKSMRQFCLLSETIEMILRTKPRTINQFNIDRTLASITRLCSRHAPSLRPSRAGTIYLHLVRLVQSILNSHRLKLQGHFHLLIQTLQSLLRCIFIPTSTPSGNKLSNLNSHPPWLSSRNHQLNSTHSTAFTRLLTLICDPTVSSVSLSSQSHLPLTSAPRDAKRLAGQHVPYILASYIRLQLDMSLRMKPEVRSSLVPGVYAILGTLDLEGRRALGEGLDAAGRAILAELVKDWVNFGKWKG